MIRSFPPLAKLFGFGVFTSGVTKFFQRVVRETIEYRENNNITRKDFLQLLIQLKNNGQLDGEEKAHNILGMALTMEEAAAQAFIFFLAGFETTSTTISFALFEMAMNQHIQEKARHEINHILNKSDGCLTYESVMELHYLETVIMG